MEFSDYTAVSPSIVIPENVPNNFINDIVLTVSDGVGEDFIQLGMYTSS